MYMYISHLYRTTGNHSFDYMDLCCKLISLLFNRFVISFLLASKLLFISWLKSLPTVVLEPKKIKSDSFHFFPIYLHEVVGPNAIIFVF